MRRCSIPIILAGPAAVLFDLAISAAKPEYTRGTKKAGGLAGFMPDEDGGK